MIKKVTSDVRLVPVNKFKTVVSIFLWLCFIIEETSPPAPLSHRRGGEEFLYSPLALWERGAGGRGLLRSDHHDKNQQNGQS